MRIGSFYRPLVARSDWYEIQDEPVKELFPLRNIPHRVKRIERFSPVYDDFIKEFHNRFNESDDSPYLYD